MHKSTTNNEFEQQLYELKKSSTEKFNQLIKNSFDMIVLLDANGVQQYVSESCERILGFKPEELINISVIDKMIHPDDQEKTLAGLTEILENATNGGVQYRHLHKNGSWVYLEAFGTNQINNLLIKSVVLNVRDISERKKTEKELLENRARLMEANNTKDRFFSIIGHDLKSPFNSIMGFSEILLNKIQKKEYNDLENYAKIIHHSSERAMNLLTNLLEWSRTQTGSIKYNPENFEFVSAVYDVVDLLNDSAIQKSINISTKLPQQINIVADKAMMKTILRNLLTNAIKFTNPGGQITISIENKAKELIVSVTDNGVGIKKEDLNKLFRIDYSHSTVGTNKETGTGLGLLLCKEFIEMHNGTIWAESNKTNGSIFNFTLPLKQ
jgi:PAS domain S-box-containing protein